MIKDLTFIFLLLICSFQKTFTQEDSLWIIWKNSSSDDTIKLQALYDIVWKDYLFSDKDSTLYYCDVMDAYAKQKGQKKYQALSNKLKGISYTINGDNDQAIASYQKGLLLFKEINDSKGIANTYNNIGLLYRNIGEYYLALDSYAMSLNIEKKEGNKEGMADVLGNMGTIYQFQGIYPLALEHHQKCLQLRIAIGDKQGQAKAVNNIGNINFESGDFELAIQKYSESLKIFEELEDVNGMSTSYNNIGNIYYVQKDYDLALDYYQKCLDIYTESSNKGGEAAALLNIGMVYRDQGNYEAALESVKKSLYIRISIDDKKGIAMSQHNLARIYLLLKQYKPAFEAVRSSLDLARKIGSLSDIKEAASLLYQMDKDQNNHKEALEMYELFIFTRDSMYNEDNTKNIIKQQYQFEYDKKTTADSVILGEKMKVKNAELAKSHAETEKQRLESESQKKQKAFLFGGLALVALFGFFMYNRFKVTQKQKGIIEDQKKEVESQKITVEKTLQELETIHNLLEESHKEITDSINYAERIQRSFLATKEILDEHLKDYFVFFKPKEAVSGDFYWAAQLNNNNFAFTVADSTGHGVPGAIMSLLNITSLEKSIETETEPHNILNKTREIIINRLKKDGSEHGGKDGMDCNLMVLNQDKSILSFASANNTIVIIRDGEIMEYKGDKMPVGKHDKDSETFTLHSVQLQKGDVIYALTDGFPDQFGGPNGKKYMIKNLKNKFLQIAYLSMKDQEEALNAEFANWKAENEQIDDVCIIGVRV